MSAKSIVYNGCTWFWMLGIQEKRDPGPHEDTEPYEHPGPFEDSGHHEDPGSYEDPEPYTDLGPFKNPWLCEEPGH